MPKEKEKIAIFIDHDIFVRHFLKPDSFDVILKKYKVTLVVPSKGNKRLKSDLSFLSNKLDLIRLDVPDYRRLLWSRLVQIKAMSLSLNNSQKIKIRTAWKRALNKKAIFLHTILSLPLVCDICNFFIRTILSIKKFEELEKLFLKNNFKAVLHPGIDLGIYINDLRILTKEKKIPLIFIMNSWDNPSVSVKVTPNVDYYLAWGEQTKNHAIKFLGMPENNVFKFGASQFEIYKTKPLKTKRDFYRLNKINYNNKILLYAGGSLGTNEFEHLKSLEEMVDQKHIKNISILYRPHPWGGGGNRGNEILNHNWKHVKIESYSKKYLKSLRNKGYHMTFPDYSETHIVLSHVDFVISPLSTILIEAALHKKPIMCFLPLEELNSKHFQDVYELTHFVDLQNERNVIMAYGKKEMLNKLRLLLETRKSRNFELELLKMCNYYVCQHDKSYKERIYNLTKKIIEENN